MENVHSATRNLKVYNKTHKQEDDNLSFKQRMFKKVDKWWSTHVCRVPQLGPEEEMEVEQRFQADAELRKLQGTDTIRLVWCSLVYIGSDMNMNINMDIGSVY